MFTWEENEVEAATISVSQSEFPKERPKCVDRFYPEKIAQKNTPHQVSKTLVKVTHCNEGKPADIRGGDHQKISPNQSLKASLERYSIEGLGFSALSGEAYTYTVESFEISIHELVPSQSDNSGELHSHILPCETRKSGVNERSFYRLWNRFRSAKKSV